MIGIVKNKTGIFEDVREIRNTLPIPVHVCTVQCAITNIYYLH